MTTVKQKLAAEKFAKDWEGKCYLLVHETLLYEEPGNC